MDEKKREQQQEQRDTKRDTGKNNPIPQEQQVTHEPGKDAAAKSTRKGAGQQQESGGNPVVNS